MKIIQRILATLLVLGVSALPLRAQNRGDWPMQGLSALGKWRGYLECGREEWAAEVVVKFDGRYGPWAEVSYSPGTSRNLFTRYWSSYATYSAEVQFRTPNLRLTPLRWTSPAPGPGMMAMELRLAPGGRLVGQVTSGHCSYATLERWEFAPSAQEVAERRFNRGISSELPLRGLVGNGGLSASWHQASACRPPVAQVEVSASDPRLLSPASPTYQRFTALLEDAIALECPGAILIYAQVAGSRMTWAVGQRAQWAPPSVASTPQPPRPLVGPARLPPIQTLPVENRAAAARAQVTAVAGQYRASMAAVLAANGSVPGRDYAPYYLTIVAGRACTRPPVGMSPDAVGRACYFAGLATAGLIDTREAYGTFSLAGDARNAADLFVKCAEHAHLRECALMGEYVGVIGDNTGLIEAARRQLATATRTISSPEAAVREILPVLFALRREQLRDSR